MCLAMLSSWRKKRQSERWMQQGGRWGCCACRNVRNIVTRLSMTRLVLHEKRRPRCIKFWSLEKLNLRYPENRDLSARWPCFFASSLLVPPELGLFLTLCHSFDLSSRHCCVHVMASPPNSSRPLCLAAAFSSVVLACFLLSLLQSYPRAPPKLVMFHVFPSPLAKAFFPSLLAISARWPKSMASNRASTVAVLASGIFRAESLPVRTVLWLM